MLTDHEIAHWGAWKEWESYASQLRMADPARFNNEYAVWCKKNDEIEKNNPTSYNEFMERFPGASIRPNHQEDKHQQAEREKYVAVITKAEDQFKYTLRKICNSYGFFTKEDLYIPFIRAAKLIKTMWMISSETSIDESLPEFVSGDNGLLYNLDRVSFSKVKDHPCKAAVFRLIKNEDIFFNDTFIAIYRASKTLNDAGKMIDLCNVHDQYRRQFQDFKNELPEMSDADYIGTILTTIESEYQTLVTPWHVEQCIMEHLHWYVTAKTSFYDDLKSTLLRQGVSKEWIDQRYQAKIQELKACIPVKLESFSDQVESAIFSLETKSDALSTDLTDLDYMLKLRRGCLYYIGGRPGMGKTALSLHLLQLSQLRENKKKTLFFSLEMSKEQLIHRLVCSVGEINASAIKDKRLSEFDHDLRLAYQKASNEIKSLNIHLVDTGIETIASVQTICEQVKDKDGEVGLIIIDYLQLLKGTSKNRNQMREQEVSEISRALKLLAKACDCPVICLTQLNRQVEGRLDKRPGLSDLRESGSLEQDADAVLMLYRADYYDKDAPSDLEIIVSKNRHGSLGTAIVDFNRETQKISNINRNSYKW